MSASLVGSEMCIRDSLKGLPPGRLGHRQVSRATTCPEWLRLRRLPHTAVSYTHLTLPTICSV
eukprot:14302910-Alexandrium_andersonii.AAC.1